PSNQPSNVTPANNAVDVSLTPTLRSSEFSNTDDTHEATQWHKREGRKGP
ncbi:unnamed protein product, partial [marine sediment metagenome]